MSVRVERTVGDRDWTKFGRTTTYRASAEKWDDDKIDTTSVAYGEFSSLPAAQAEAICWLHHHPDYFVIHRGTWVKVRLDREWEMDENWIVNGWANGDGGIEWVEESW